MTTDPITWGDDAADAFEARDPERVLHPSIDAAAGYAAAAHLHSTPHRSCCCAAGLHDAVQYGYREGFKDARTLAALAHVTSLTTEPVPLPGPGESACYVCARRWPDHGLGEGHAEETGHTVSFGPGGRAV